MSKRKIKDISTEDSPSFEAVETVRKPKSVIDKVIAAIRFHKSHNGSSLPVIQKFCRTEYGHDNIASIKRALKAGVVCGQLLKKKQSYLVANDPTYSDTRDKVDITIISEGDSSMVVNSGDTCTISYKGKLLDGSVFDMAKAFTFTAGAGDVIKGMDEGILGMGVGGHRILTIPSSLGYGKKGSSPDIPPDSTLVFDVKLKSLS